ncbi:MAG: hypothetical protein JXA97_10205 [Anaerolineales bacterium]|nr:hypothetical protein [Anaerolineales bacterium]
MNKTTTLKALLLPEGQQALKAAVEAAPDDDSFLSVFQNLERTFPRELARAAVEQAILRAKARSKFPQAGRMFFLRESLEQASSTSTANWRSQRFQEARLVFDMGCGIGGDAYSLTAAAPVVAIDHDELRLTILRMNAAALGCEARLQPVQADVRQLPIRIPSGSAFFFDPARRVNGRRIHHVQNYHPGLSTIRPWLEAMLGGGVKISPAVRYQEIEEWDCEVEFISVGHQLKEAMLWFGALKSARRRATVLPAGVSLVDDALYNPDLAEPQRYIYEPDPAVMRASLVRALGRNLGLKQLDQEIALLTGENRLETPFARRYRLQAVLPANLKQLRRDLRSRNIGSVTIKKRGSGVDVEDYRRKLRLEGENEATIYLTRVNGKKSTLLVDLD